MIDLVMLIDDNETDNFISKRIIEITEFAKRVEVKNSGQHALEYLSEHANDTDQLPSLIFLDINMPVMDGYQTLNAILEHNLDTTVIVISGDVQPSAHEHHGKRFCRMGQSASLIVKYRPEFLCYFASERH